MADGAEDRIASGYDAFYAAWGQSATLDALWRDLVTGPDFPEEFAHISFLPLAELRALVDGLALTPTRLLADLACGAGGPGLWAAHQTGARLVGVDLSPVAVDVASRRAGALGLSDRASFQQGSFEVTGLGDASVDAAMTVDALQYAPDKTKAIAEMARIVRPGGRLGIVAFELDADHVAGLGVWEDPVGDYAPLLEANGFDVVEHRQIEGWRAAVERGFGRVVEEQQALMAELGEAAGAGLVLEASITLELDPYRGHAFIVTERR